MGLKIEVMFFLLKTILKKSNVVQDTSSFRSNIDSATVEVVKNVFVW